MEASALHAPATGRRPLLSSPLLRLRSDEQLVALVRAGSEDAFAAIHDRYRQRLFAYVRQMLSQTSRADAEDVLQDVFVRAYRALRADGRDVNLRAWLYRVAHNRCIDHLRRPVPPSCDLYDVSRTPLLDPIETAQRRDDLKRLVDDVGRLPDQQRSALLMREIDGLSYADIAAALDVTVPAVKSLLVRARVGLVEAAEARDTDCAVIRADLAAAYDRGVKASSRARKHMRECAGCRDYRTALRGVRRSFAALTPVAALGPFAFIVEALGGGAAASSGAAAGGAATAAGTGIATVTATKVAAVVATAVVATGGAVEARKLTHRHADRAPKAHAVAGATAASRPPARAAAAATVPMKVSSATVWHATAGPVSEAPTPPVDAFEEPQAQVATPVDPPAAVTPEQEPVVTAVPAVPTAPPVAVPTAEPPHDPGGAVAPEKTAPPPPSHAPSGAAPATGGVHPQSVIAAPATTQPVAPPPAQPGPPPAH